MMTIQWITAIGIVDDWPRFGTRVWFCSNRASYFPIVLFVQLFLIKYCLLKIGIKKSCFYTDSYFC